MESFCLTCITPCENGVDAQKQAYLVIGIQQKWFQNIFASTLFSLGAYLQGTLDGHFLTKYPCLNNYKC